MSSENNECLDDVWKKKFFRTYFDINVDKETFNQCLDYKNNHIPNSLFKYSKVKNAISLLSDDLMFLPKIEDLNDPFECNIFYDLDMLLDNLNDYLVSFMDYSDFVDENATEEDISKFLKNRFKEPFEEVLLELEYNFKNRLSIICLSEDCCINPMWAHYADNHKGVCIEYDFKNISELIFKHLCFPIGYVEKADNSLELSSLFDDNIKTNSNWILRLALKKSYDWKYEKSGELLFLNLLQIISRIIIIKVYTLMNIILIKIILSL